MFVVTNRLAIAPEGAAAFEENFARSMKDTLGDVPGLRRATLMRPEKEGLPFVSTMEFDEKQNFLDWLKSDSFKASHSNTSAPGMNAQNSIETHSMALVIEG